MIRPRLALGAGIATAVIAGVALVPTIAFGQTAEDAPPSITREAGAICGPGLGFSGAGFGGHGGGAALAEALGITTDELREAQTTAREAVSTEYPEHPLDEAEREAAKALHRSALASALGITVDALTAAEETVRAAHVAEAVERIEAKVADGTLTRERADEIIESIESGERSPGQHRGGFRFGGPRDGGPRGPLS